MKKIISCLLVVALISSLFVINSFAANTCVDFVHLYDENFTKVADLGTGKQDLGDIGSYVQGKGAKYVHIQGWYSEEGEIVDMGYSVNGDDPIWGCGKYDEKIIGKTGFTHAYRFYIDAPIISGEDNEISIWYKLDDGEEGECNKYYTYSCKVATGSFLISDFVSVKYIKDAIAPSTASFQISGYTEGSNYYIGVFPESANPEKITKTDSIGWETKATAEYMNFDVATFKTSSAEELVPGNYYLVLYEPDTYKTVSFATFDVKPSADDVMHFDGMSIGDEVVSGNENIGDSVDLEDISDFAENPDGINILGWFASDDEVTHIGYKYTNGTEGFFEVSAARTDAAAASSTLFGYGINFNVPMLKDGDQAFDMVVRFADGSEESYKTIYYYCLGDGNTKAPTATPKPTAVPTDTPAPTDAPSATDAPTVTDAPTATDAPSATDAPKDEKKSGCGSVVVSGLAVIALAGVAFVIRKKD